MKLLDTSFLIDLQREWIRGEDGPARTFLGRSGQEEFCISTVSVLEFLEGYPHPGDGERFLSPFPKLDVTTSVARTGGGIRRKLRMAGALIGDFDILIAATAMTAGIPLVTDNLRHFERIEGLMVDGYR